MSKYIFKYTVQFTATGVSRADAAVQSIPGLVDYDFIDIEEAD